MSLDQILLLPPGYGFDSTGGGDSPTVFTLVLDDLLTRFAENTDFNPSIKFKLTATAGTTPFIYLDSVLAEVPASGTIATVEDLATEIGTRLDELTGYSGKVTVNGVSSEAGDKYTFTITFDGSLGAVTLDFDASSQWYPTITLTEAVTQDGRNAVAGVAEVFLVNMGGTGSTGFEDGSVSGSVEFIDGLVNSVTVPSGYSQSLGGVGESFVEFTANDLAAKTDMYVTGGSGSLTVTTQGVDPVAGVQEIHTITATPVYPNGGNWKPLGAGNSVGYSAAEGAIESEIEPNIYPVTVTASGFAGISDGVVTVTWDVEDSQNDAALSPVNVDLTAPEITHSIS